MLDLSDRVPGCSSMCNNVDHRGTQRGAGQRYGFCSAAVRVLRLGPFLLLRTPLWGFPPAASLPWLSSDESCSYSQPICKEKGDFHSTSPSLTHCQNSNQATCSGPCQKFVLINSIRMQQTGQFLFACCTHCTVFGEPQYRFKNWLDV